MHAGQAIACKLAVVLAVPRLAITIFHAQIYGYINSIFREARRFVDRHGIMKDSFIVEQAATD